MLLVDGTEPEMMRNILEVEVDTKERFFLAAAKLYDSAGGYTPTIGIIGAVMGLIQVMEIWPIRANWDMVLPSHLSPLFMVLAWLT